MVNGIKYVKVYLLAIFVRLKFILSVEHLNHPTLCSLVTIIIMALRF